MVEGGTVAEHKRDAAAAELIERLQDAAEEANAPLVIRFPWGKVWRDIKAASRRDKETLLVCVITAIVVAGVMAWGYLSK